MIEYKMRGYFVSNLFNEVVEDYFEKFLVDFVKKYAMISAKGSSGQQFKDNIDIYKTVTALHDMPYHIHIINGLLPSLKLLEKKFNEEEWTEKGSSDTLLRCFVVGFTFHDINKLTVDKDLKDATEHFISLFEDLKVENFFPKWKDWIEEIKFLALGTEYRTKIYAHQRDIKEYEFFNTVLAEYCHLADSISSIEEFSNVSEFYEQVCKKSLDGERLTDLWQLSFIEVNENIFTLLSQKLLFTAKTFIQDERKQTVLFSLKNGFVYIGQSLNVDEIKIIKNSFKSDLSDPVKIFQLDFQTCKFGFLESLREENESENKYHGQIKNALEKILKAGFINKGSGSDKIKPFAITNYSKFPKNDKTKEIENLEKLIDKNELPLTLHKANDGYFLRLNKEWDEVEEQDKKFLELYALEKIKILSSKNFSKWKPNKDLCKKYSPASRRTAIALINVIKLQKDAEISDKTFDDVLASVWSEVIKTLAESSLIKTVDSKELDDFVEFYLLGNFMRDIEKLPDFIDNIPEKKDMCIFTGRKAKIKYGAERAFGISALNFSNRSLNTLKSKDNRISSLFLQENDLRLKELPRGFYTKKLKKDEDKNNFRREMFLNALDANAVIYYDFGEYFVDISNYQLLEVLSKAFSYDCRDVSGLALIFDSQAYDFNLYGMNFNKVDENIKSNFYFVHQLLKLIQRTGFRVFVSGILTPYHFHKEIFVFENCMPFVKKLGWDKIRIDQIENKLKEINMLLMLGSNKLVGNVLNYAEDKQSIFTAFMLLNDDDKKKARNKIIEFIKLNEEVLRMTVMNELAQIAIEMIRPKSGSTSQESWIIRDALKVMKDCHKEGRDKETIIEQIAGDLRKTLKNKDYVDLSKCEPFARTLYEKLFEQEWKKLFPQPGRLRNWVNQFAFLYSDKGYKQIRKRKLIAIIKKLKENGDDFSMESVIRRLIEENKKIEKYVGDYREVFPEAISELK